MQKLRINSLGKLVEKESFKHYFLDGYINWNVPTGTPWNPIETYYVGGQFIERLP